MYVNIILNKVCLNLALTHRYVIMNSMALQEDCSNVNKFRALYSSILSKTQ